MTLYNEIFPMTHHFYPLQVHDVNHPTAFQTFFNTLQQSKVGATENLIYVHIPYCEKHCLFCPFHINVRRNEAIYDQYVQTMLKEMEIIGQQKYVQDMTFDAVYIGGGSPSLLSLPSVKAMFDGLRKNFNIKEDAEWTFEGEPHSLSEDELLSYLAEEKVRRISYGVQTFDQELREKLNIGATVEDVIACYENGRKHGFNDINIDMMFHLPGHTIEDLETDIRKIQKYGFDSVDYYYLSYFGFPKKVIQDMETGLFPPKPPEELRHQMSKYVRQRMIELEYSHVTDHVFSRLHKSSDYYRLLWGGGDGEYRAETLAIGSSARGYIGGISYANTTDPVEYMKKVNDGEIPLFKVSDRLKDPQNRGLVFFPKFFRIEKNRVLPGTKEHHAFQTLIKHGLVEETIDFYVMTDEGKEWIPNITMDFFEESQITIAGGWVNKLMSNFNNKVTM